MYFSLVYAHIIKQGHNYTKGGRVWTEYWAKAAHAYSVHIEGRELMSVSGVKDVDCFNEAEIELLTDAGQLRIEGSGLHITKLSLDEGQVIVEGEILALEYSEDAQQRGSLFSRMFR